MTAWALGALLLSLLLPALAASEPLTPALLSVQWAWTPSGTLADRCDAPNGGGYSCLAFPEGGTLHAIEWQSAVKTPCHEVLLMLTIDGGGQPLYIHHVAWGGALMPPIVRSVRGPLAIPPGARVWIHAIGGPLCDFPHVLSTYPVEVQATLLVTGTAVPVWP